MTDKLVAAYDYDTERLAQLFEALAADIRSEQALVNEATQSIELDAKDCVIFEHTVRTAFTDDSELEAWLTGDAL